jgi:dihydrofolate synthase/folylpolyglutamate synthase
MNYSEALETINNRAKFHTKSGLNNMIKLMHELKDPQNSLKFIHVAGTNGKGTTATFISSVLMTSGYSVGLFTSPYVLDFRERFKMNDVMITESELCDILEKVMHAVKRLENDGIEVTFFELITAIAFCWYHIRKPDFVVLEVGIGGRLDATNIIEPPIVSVITSISLDHTKILGDTIEKIAFEKAGIIKNGSIVALYPDMSEKALIEILKVAKSKGVNCRKADIDDIQVHKSDLFGSDFSYLGKNYHISFMGQHQIYNAVNAITAVTFLKDMNYHISDENIKTGLNNAFIPARMEVLSQNPLIILDGGHNPDCAAALKKVIERNLNEKYLIGIIGMMADKDTDSYMKTICTSLDLIITVTVNSNRSIEGSKLAEKLQGICENVKTASSIEEAVNQAIVVAREKSGAVIICGSFYLASDVRKILKHAEIE